MHQASQSTTLLTFEELHEVQQRVVAARAGGELTHALHHFFGILRHVPQLEHVLWSKTAQSCSQRSKSLHCYCFGGQIKKKHQLLLAFQWSFCTRKVCHRVDTMMVKPSNHEMAGNVVWSAPQNSFFQRTEDAKKQNSQDFLIILFQAEFHLMWVLTAPTEAFTVAFATYLLMLFQINQNYPFEWLSTAQWLFLIINLLKVSTV